MAFLLIGRLCLCQRKDTGLTDEINIDDVYEDWICDAYRPVCGPPGDIYAEAVPIWTGKTHRELAEKLGWEYACGFAWGFEKAIVMGCVKPEWARGLYLALREHYLTSHTENDMEAWEHHAEATARAIPIQRTTEETTEHVRTDR
jgi:hypothetical protein